jgi:hypothetical protein
MTSMNAWHYYRKQHPRRIGCAHTLIQLMKVDIDRYEGLEPMRDVWDLRCLRRRLQIPAKVLRDSLLEGAPRGGITRHSDIAGIVRPLVTTA